jgi:hypothetical protein
MSALLEQASTFNNMFMERVQTQEGMEKMAAVGSAYIKSFLREHSVSRKILPPESITRAECQRSTRNDTIYKIVDFEAPSTAVALNFRGTGRERYIQGKRYALPFFKIESDLFSKQEAELLAYDYPVTKVIEENSIKDIMAIEDAVFLKYVSSATSTTGKKIVSGDTSVNRLNLTKLFKMIDGDKLQSTCVLLTNVDWDDFQVLPATDVGSNLASEMTVNGYKYETLLKRKAVVTNKTDLLAPGRIIAFTDPAYLGNFFLLGDVKFWIKKEADKIYWKTWEYIAEGFANIRSIAEINLAVPAPVPNGGSF